MSGGEDNAKAILIAEGLLDDEEIKYTTKPAKHTSSSSEPPSNHLSSEKLIFSITSTPTNVYSSTGVKKEEVVNKKGDLGGSISGGRGGRGDSGVRGRGGRGKTGNKISFLFSQFVFFK